MDAYLSAMLRLLQPMTLQISTSENVQRPAGSLSSNQRHAASCLKSCSVNSFTPA